MTATTSERRRLTYVPALDGLRALAIGLVVVDHFTYGHLPGGLFGVDVFFVLSGFLITSLVVREFDQSSDFSFREFYWRRARRLLPALAASVVVSGLIWSSVRESVPSRPFWVAGLAVLLYMGNWLAVFDRNSLGPLGVTWSLAIEEQFYLLWPPVLVALMRRKASTARLITIALALAVVGFAFGVAGRHWTHWDMYHDSLPRFAEIMVGCALGIAVSRQALSGKWRALGSFTPSALGLAFIAVSSVKGRQSTNVLFQCHIVLICVAAAALIAHCATEESVITRVLSLPPAVFVGQLSYSLYLVHFPVQSVIAAGWMGLGSHVIIPLRFVISFALAWLSYRFIEAPARRLPMPKALARA